MTQGYGKSDYATIAGDTATGFKVLHGWGLREVNSATAGVTFRDGLVAPTAVVGALISPAAAGNVDNGAHSYKISYVTASGESNVSVKSNVVTVANKTVNGKVTLTLPLSKSPRVTSRKIYRTEAAADPDVAANFKLLATVADNTTTTYTDNIADTSLTDIAPTADASGAAIIPLAFAADAYMYESGLELEALRGAEWTVDVTSGTVEGAVFGVRPAEYVHRP